MFVGVNKVVIIFGDILGVEDNFLFVGLLLYLGIC